MAADLRCKQIKRCNDLPKAKQKVPVARQEFYLPSPSPAPCPQVTSSCSLLPENITEQHEGGSQRAAGGKQAAASAGLAPSTPQASEEPQLQIKRVPRQPIKQRWCSRAPGLCQPALGVILAAFTQRGRTRGIGHSCCSGLGVPKTAPGHSQPAGLGVWGPLGTVGAAP